MGESKTVTFVSQEYLPVTRDGLDLRLEFTVVDSDLRGAPEETSATTSGQMIIGISRTLASVWGLEPAARDKVLLEFARRHIRGKVQDGTLTDREELHLTTGNTPTPCPFDPNRITVAIGQPMEFTMEDKNPVQAAEPSGTAARIIDLRDNVNAIFHERYGEDLLSLPQERALLELFRPCRSQEEFGYRVAALAGLAGAINGSALKQQIREESSDMRPIQALRAYLTQKSTAIPPIDICDPLSYLNRLRQMYPIHTDDAGGVIEAHRFFGLDYPIRDWPRAWKYCSKHMLGP